MERLEDFVMQLRDRGQKKRVAVVNADDSHTLEAVIRAQKEQIVYPILIGNKDIIKARLDEIGCQYDDAMIVGSNGNEEAANHAIELVRSGDADLIMKGRIETKDLMKIIVDKKSNLRTERVMSHLAILEIPTYHKLVGITDTTLNTTPDFKQKVQIVENAVLALIKMGIKTPKVAALAAAEEVNVKLSESTDALKLKELYLAGGIKGCIIEGPISYDLAINKDAAVIKKFDSPVAGDSDLLLVPNLTAGNLCVKALIFSGNTKSAGIILGARVPIVVVSRSSTAEDKYYSLVLGASAC